MANHKEITELLERLSRATWERLRWSSRLDLSQNEETITDINLLDIARANLPGISIGKVPSRIEESKIGIDWDFVVGNSSIGWVRFAVQAKKIDYKTEKYESLGKKVRKFNVLQIDLLDKYAKKQKAVPIYCLYNFVERNDYHPFWHCGRRLARKQLGCSVTPSFLIRKFIKTKPKKTSFDDIHKEKETLPWRCLTCWMTCSAPSCQQSQPAISYFREMSYSKELPTDFQPSNDREINFRLFEERDIFPRWAMKIEINADISENIERT